MDFNIDWSVLKNIPIRYYYEAQFNTAKFPIPPSSAWDYISNTHPKVRLEKGLYIISGSITTRSNVGSIGLCTAALTVNYSQQYQSRSSFPINTSYYTSTRCLAFLNVETPQDYEFNIQVFTQNQLEDATAYLAIVKLS